MSASKGPLPSLRRFGLFLVLLILVSGILVLTANGLYYWYSQPIKATYGAARTSLLGGMPPNARTEAERLAFFTSGITSLQSLPSRLDDLNRQPWTLVVLLKEDLDAADVQTLLDQAARGQKAAAAYHEAVAGIEKTVTAFNQQAGEPVIDAKSLTRSLQWYTERLRTVEQMETDYAGLARIADLDLIGTLFTPADLGIQAAVDSIKAWQQPVRSLQEILAASTALENRLDALYARDPSIDGLAAMTKTCTDLLAEQQDITRKASALTDGVPLPLQPAWQYWQSGAASRSRFIDDLQAWWQYDLKVSQSIRSATADRATARRYITDSLKETNVETAYLWTRTAQEYRVSMITAIDFANIAITQTNQQLQILAASRQAYRTALGLASAVRQIPEMKTIQPDEFWLEG